MDSEFDDGAQNLILTPGLPEEVLHESNAIDDDNNQEAEVASEEGNTEEESIVKGAKRHTRKQNTNSKGSKKDKPKVTKKEKRAIKDAVTKLFDQFYSEMYKTRWTTLYEALNGPTRYCCLLNAFVSKELPQRWKEDYLMPPPLACYVMGSGDQDKLFPPPAVDAETNLMDTYLLDAASLLPVLALAPEPDDAVLDMCAAPGGKTIAMAMMMFQDGKAEGSIQANEMAAPRRDRLLRNIKSYIPYRLHDKVRISGRDGTVQGALGGPYDKILIDAPCSSERHLIQSPPSLLQWRSGHSRTLSERQLKLLLHASSLLAYGGRIVYATCALSTIENDQVISAALRKTKLRLVTDEELAQNEWWHHWFAPGESSPCVKTAKGFEVMPDRGGWGPIYFSVLTLDA